LSPLPPASGLPVDVDALPLDALEVSVPCDEQAANRLTAARAPRSLLYIGINPCQTL